MCSVVHLLDVQPQLGAVGRHHLRIRLQGEPVLALLSLAQRSHLIIPSHTQHAAAKIVSRDSIFQCGSQWKSYIHVVSDLQTKGARVLASYGAFYETGVAVLRLRGSFSGVALPTDAPVSHLAHTAGTGDNRCFSCVHRFTRADSNIFPPITPP